MTAIQKRLFSLRDEKYASFQSKLTPTVDPKLFIGVRVPYVRNLASKLAKGSPDEVGRFLGNLPHEYYDENMLHGLLVSEIRDFSRCIAETDAFLPFVDNWAVCDIMSPKCFAKHKAELLPVIRRWVASGKEFTVRFGLEMLMSHYLDDDFRPEYLEIAASVRSDRYYVNMMVAWFFATALAKQWNSAVPFMERRVLDPWVHDKSIQKARESRRISPERKEYLLGLKH